MPDSQLAASVLALLDGTADTFLVCAGAGAVVSQKTADQAKTLLALVKADVGLGNVDNTADTAKPISTAQQTALDAKQATLVSGTNIKTVNSTSLLGSGDLVVSASPGGSSGQVQYNNAGAFGGTTALLYAGSVIHVAITSQGATIVPLCVKGAASQSGDLQQWKNSSDVSLVTVSSAGNLRLFRSTGSDVIELDRNSSGQGRLIARATTGSYPGSGVVLDVNNTADLVSYSAGSPNSYFRAAAQPQVYEAGSLVGIWYQSAYWSWTHRTTTPTVWSDRPALYSRAVGGVTKWHMMDSSGNVLVLDPLAFGTDNSSTAGHTRFFLWDVDKGALSRVTVGAADSGGTGFKLLRVPN